MIGLGSDKYKMQGEMIIRRKEKKPSLDYPRKTKNWNFGKNGFDLICQTISYTLDSRDFICSFNHLALLSLQIRQLESFFPITEFALSAALNRKITHANVKSCYQEPEYETKDGAAI